MAKYEIEQLIQLRETAYVPTSVDFAEFTKSILEERERQAQQEEESGFTGGRRRSSIGIRPKFKTNRPKRAPAPQPDADGWVTLDNHRKSASGEEAANEKQKFKDSLKSDTTQVKVRPNNKNLGSSKPVDSRDIIADQQKSTFNAFAALGDESDEESEEDDE
ncbi:Cap-associated protein CAF20 [Wickerhamomyces ciferrii]|uniref:Cap-associated protein CAF20 n=1 Tax=Wickerhamomyces ciferrii (strain ATCC 14091 / BCRC 22168 / CBS 111 / JCM 3599 / NBRC 0793 / NRRL Y-1031 F-60-10) TaxID=1206466 RepID=K0KIN8_WICCF|nr:Cap-associated protein CAF20 [Wickerhamomyces ciferrii]CCH41028.1 Cap-associated protein CAF20 [Wickerhamomyces ciferrii]